MGWVGATIWHAGRTALVVTQTHENLFHALFHAVPMRKARDLDHVTCLDLNRSRPRHLIGSEPISTMSPVWI